MTHIGKMMAARSIRKCRIRPSLYLVGFLLLVGTICFYTKLDFTVLRGFGVQIETIFVNVFDNSDYLMKTPGCLIVKYDPLDSRIAFYFKKLKPVVCPTNAVDVLVYLEDGLLKVHEKGRRDIIEASMSKFKEKTPDFKCRRWTVYREKVEENDNAYRISDNYTEFVNWTTMEDEFVKVQCFYSGHPIYHNYFFNMVKKPELESELAFKESTFLSQHPECDRDRLGVLILGVDSVSRMNFFRQFPRTHSLLTTNLSALDFFGYNKVGLNTFPCLMPMLTGMSVTELQNSCWGGGMNHFDNCTTIWDMFADAGYRTAFVENLNNYGLFTFNKNGFRRQPVHYYSRTMYLPVMKYVGNFFGGCWRGLADDEQLAQWALQFQRTFHDAPHFGHFWMSRWSHDDVNTAQHMDPYLYDVVSRMIEDGLLNKTLLILMSDHGVRYGSFRETEYGRLEEDLPYLFLAFPEWFRRKYPRAMERLEENRRRLISTFDLHETFKSIMNCDYNNDAFMVVNATIRDRGVSLFQRISPDRTCDDAGVPSIYCGCREDVQTLDVASPKAKMLAALLVDAVNGLTSAHRNVCVSFAVKSVLSAKELKSAAISTNSSAGAIESTHVVAILAEPGNAKLEATIHKFVSNGSYVVNNDIRRINRYGDTSHCIVNDSLLKSICYCKVQIT